MQIINTETVPKYLLFSTVFCFLNVIFYWIFLPLENNTYLCAL